MERDILSFKKIDERQQDRWEKAGLFKTAEIKEGDKKFYCLDMFPYPSGQGLHVGHPEGYTASDILTRYKRMNGCKVLHPMGWDAFGLPAENYAVETGIHPEITTKKNIDTFRRQIKSFGMAYDWEREICTTDPQYYKWTQWIFIQLFKKGLAYKADIPINWCPSCKTGLANEEVFAGKCERCSAVVEKKNLKQWMLKITAYADRLLEDLKELDWPASTLLMQENWIGKSVGARIIFEVADTNLNLEVFTTRADTIFGTTYMVVSPEHPLLGQITKPQCKTAVEEYIKSAKLKADTDRLDETKEKTGVFTGAYCVNPANGEKIPVWTADYVLATYGTGAIMAVPAHDGRDFAFAKKYGLKIVEVVKPTGGEATDDGLFTGRGICVNSGFLDGLDTAKATEKIIGFLEEKKSGGAETAYKLRDWVFSRQRYWGEPIPVVHCKKCGAVPVDEKDLPVALPQLDKFQPSGTGASPLAAVKDWVETKCPKCGGPAERETDTMPQWAGSCWYYLRYIDPKNETRLCAGDLQKKWLPVDCYIGGTEHAVLHLLYARFWHKFLFDVGVVSSNEPFKKLRHQGMILAVSYRDGKGIYHPYDEVVFSADGKPALKNGGEPLTAIVEKMSKSKKNVVNPDEILEEYGADAFRMYEMFMGPFEQAKPWDMKGIEGVSRFLKKIWFWADKYVNKEAVFADKPDDEIEILLHKTIDKVSQDIENFRFNTAVSAMMIFFNTAGAPGKKITAAQMENFLKILHPFAPHITEEIWEKLGRSGFVADEKWPLADKTVIGREEVEIGVQINGKLRARIKTGKAAVQDEVRALALGNEKIKCELEGKRIEKVIVVPGRLVSIVAK